jgi:hypothetical protein
MAMAKKKKQPVKKAQPASRTLGPSAARVSERAQAQPSTVRVRLDGVKMLYGRA